MNRHGISVPELFEIKAEDEGYNICSGIWRGRPSEQGEVGFDASPPLKQTFSIGLRLRRDNDHGEFRPLNLLSGILVHELAHCWHSPHDLTFHRKWRSLTHELTYDLDNVLRIDPGLGQSPMADSFFMLEFGDIPLEALTHERDKFGRMASCAAKKWNSRHGKTQDVQEQHLIAELTARRDEAQVILTKYLEERIVQMLAAEPDARVRQEWGIICSPETKAKLLHLYMDHALSTGKVPLIDGAGRFDGSGR